MLKCIGFNKAAGYQSIRKLFPGFTHRKWLFVNGRPDLLGLPGLIDPGKIKLDSLVAYGGRCARTLECIS